MPPKGERRGGERGISRPASSSAAATPAPGPGAGSDAQLRHSRCAEAGSPTGAPRGRAFEAKALQRVLTRHRGFARRRRCPVCGAEVGNVEEHCLRHVEELRRSGAARLERLGGTWLVVVGGRAVLGLGWEALRAIAELRAGALRTGDPDDA